jgi:hypothetical protein
LLSQLFQSSERVNKMETEISYNLRLKEGVGPINLGMSRQEIRTILGEPRFSTNTDYTIRNHYASIGPHIDYIPKTAICKGIEVLHGVELIYQGKNILDLRWSNMFEWMLENDLELDIKGNGYTLY